jgi:hypothetical protein
MGEILLMAIVPPIIGILTYVIVRMIRRKDEHVTVHRTSGAEPRVK